MAKVKAKAKAKASERLLQALNEDLSNEIAATIQYLWHHYMAEGMESPAVIELFEKTARDEMKHIEMLASRIVYLGGDPTTQPGKIAKGGDLRKMIQDDLNAENAAIAGYKNHIKIAAEEGDPTTRLMLENILSDEEKHADIWETTLGVR
jgi:bacterioferritin